MQFVCYPYTVDTAMAVLRCWRPLDKRVLYNKNKGLKTTQIRIWSDVSVQMASNDSHGFNCILVRMLLFFLFSIEVIFVEHLSSRETKTPVVSQLRGTALSSRWSTTTVCALCSWAVGNHLHVWWIGPWGLTKWPPCDCYLRLGQGRIHYQSKSTHMGNGAANSSYICHCPAGLEGKCWVCSSQVAGVCRMLRSLLKYCAKC